MQYLPSNAGAMMLQGTYGLAHPLSPWTGFAVMWAYALVLIGFAAWRLLRATPDPIPCAWPEPPREALLAQKGSGPQPGKR